MSFGLNTYLIKICVVVDHFLYIDQISATVTKGLLPNPRQRLQELVDQNRTCMLIIKMVLSIILLKI